MTMLLAEAVPDPAALSAWLSVLFYIGGFVCTVLGGAVAVKKLRDPAPAGTPQPLVVQEHPTIATQGDIDQLHGRIKRERTELDAALAALRDEDLRMREKFDRNVQELENRIDAVPERTINLLRSTKGLIT